MKKIIIGILPTIKLNINDNPFDDNYIFVNNYSSRIIEEGAIPIGILGKDGEINEDILDICNGFLLPGGNRMYKAHYQIIDYAFKNKKPILGICLGMQAIACYSRLKEIAIEKNIEPTIDNLMNLRKELQNENIYMLEELQPKHIHGEEIQKELIEITRENILKSKHSIRITPNTKLYECYNKEKEDIISMHSYRIYESSKDFIVSAIAEDGTIEAIEYIDKNNWIVGVQFHPELEKNNPILKLFIEEINNRIKKEA